MSNKETFKLSEFYPEKATAQSVERMKSFTVNSSLELFSSVAHFTTAHKVSVQQLWTPSSAELYSFALFTTWNLPSSKLFFRMKFGLISLFNGGFISRKLCVDSFVDEVHCKVHSQQVRRAAQIASERKITEAPSIIRVYILHILTAGTVASMRSL